MILPDFLDVCNNGNLNDFNTFLKLGNNLESIINNNGLNALQIACVLGHEEIIETLIDHGFDIDISFEYDEIDHEDVFEEQKTQNSKITLFDLCDTKISDKTKVEKCRKLLIEKGIKLDMRYVRNILTKIIDLKESIDDNILLLQSSNSKMIFYAIKKYDTKSIKTMDSLDLIDKTMTIDNGNNLLHYACIKLNDCFCNYNKYIMMRIINIITGNIDLSLTNDFDETPFDMISEENHFKFMELLIDHNEEKDLLRKFQLWKQLKKDKEERDYRVFTESKINELCDRVKSLESMLDTEKNVDKFEDDRKLRKINRLDH